MNGDDGGAEEQPAEPESGDDDAEERPAEQESGSEVEPDSQASQASQASRASSPVRRVLRSSPALYFAGFFVVLISFAALALGGLALLGRGIDASPTGFFWASIVLSVAALGLALAALFAPRRR